MKIILGAGGKTQEGWVSTDIDTLDISDDRDFEKFFGNEKAEAFLLEHVAEHLYTEELETALINIGEYLAPGGNLRIAVPDGYHPDEEYINWVRPGGNGPGCDLHRQLFNCDTLIEYLVQAGFVYMLVEWWEADEKFYTIYDSLDESEYGRIERCYKNDERNADGQAHYTSLIVDAWKKK
jgi:predicted SAM-dependent methyltransferase